MLEFPLWKRVYLWAVTLFFALAAVPSLVVLTGAGWPSVLPRPMVNLGLDLAGGDHLVALLDRGDLGLVCLLALHLRADDQEPEDRDHADDRQELQPSRWRGPGGAGCEEFKHDFCPSVRRERRGYRNGCAPLQRHLPNERAPLAAKPRSGNQPASARGLRQPLAMPQPLAYRRGLHWIGT